MSKSLISTNLSRATGVRTALLPALVLGACDASTTSEPEVSTDVSGEEDSVTFADPELGAAVRRQLAILRESRDEGGRLVYDSTEMLTEADLAELTVLGGGDRAISDLGGIEHAVNLRWLNLSDNEIMDLGPLAGLDQLMSIDLSGNPLADLSPLTGLPVLEELRLASTGIDVSELSELTGLRVLDLGENGIEDVSPLNALTSLELLDLHGNRITDPAPLGGLAELQQLYLDGNRITDPAPLGRLTELEILELTENRIVDLAGLGGPAAPTALVLAGNEISDLSPLVANGGLSGSHISVRDNPLGEPALCDDVPALEAAGALVRGAEAYPTHPDAKDHVLPFIETDRDVLLSGTAPDRLVSTVASFTNRSDVVLHGNNCGTPEAWEFQLQIDRLVGGEWEIVRKAVALACGNPQTIAPGETIAFVRWSVGRFGGETGTYRLVWPTVWLEDGELAPLEHRVSAEFSVVAP